MRRPTDKDREETSQYLIERLGAIRSMSYNLEEVFAVAIDRIVRICYEHNLQPKKLQEGALPLRVAEKVDQVIEWLIETIADYFDTLVEAAPGSDKDFIIPWVKRKIHGKTFDQRLDEYCNNFRFEIMLLTAAGIVVGLGSVPLINSLIRNIRKPWNNPEIKEGLAHIPSYGVGRTNSMFTAINALTADGIASGWMKSKYLNDKERNCVGWWVERGSSYPCDICDSQTGFHYDDSSLPMYHSSCCCLAVPVFSNNKNY